MSESLESSVYEQALAMCEQEQPNTKGAYRLLVQASEEGDSRATYALATWYLFGNYAVPKDEHKAVHILKSLVDSNIAESLFDLAVSFDYGKGVRRNSKTAFSLYMRAAILGDSSSCDQISQFYSEGKVVPYDRKLSEAWKLRSLQSEIDISPPYRVWLR